MKTKNLISSVVLVISTALIMTACYKSNKDYNNNPGTSTNTIKMMNSTFSPASLTIVTGSTVTWVNNDNMVHTVTTADGSISSGDIAAGSSFSKTFSATGTFNYYDSHNTNMKGTLTVTTSSGGGY